MKIFFLFFDFFTLSRFSCFISHYNLLSASFSVAFAFSDGENIIKIFISMYLCCCRFIFSYLILL